MHSRDLLRGTDGGSDRAGPDGTNSTDGVRGPGSTEGVRHKSPRLGTVLVLAASGVLAAFFLLAEHRAHTLGVLPYLLLACPLLHLLSHGGHHGADPYGDRPSGGGRT